MSKLSVFSKAISFAVLIALVLASLPTVSVVAKGNNQGLENKWSQLVDNYTRQSSNHNSAHRWVDHWLKTKKNASVSEKNEIQKHLNICNSAIIAAGSIVSKHAGFDAQGKVIDRAAARKSIKDLSYYLRQHIGSIRNLEGHLN
jgi:UDP-3-O-[3-hydroxymyristoyl] glucosamine N-acyltransferase